MLVSTFSLEIKATLMQFHSLRKLITCMDRALQAIIFPQLNECPFISWLSITSCLWAAIQPSFPVPERGWQPALLTGSDPCISTALGSQPAFGSLGIYWVIAVGFVQIDLLHFQAQHREMYLSASLCRKRKKPISISMPIPGEAGTV